MRRFPRVAAAWALWLIGSPLAAQAPRGKPDPSLPPPPLTHRGLIPGRSTVEEVRAALGAPREEHRWYSYKLLYPSEGRPSERGTDHLDAVHLRSSNGREGDLGCIEAASIPAGFETLEKVRKALGEPEWLLLLHRQGIADYASKGLRFTFHSEGDAGDRTTGVAYFPHGQARVHGGERRFLSLRALPQGPQPPPAGSGAPPDLLVGTGRADLTPLKGDWLGPVALGKRFEPHDPLYARCAVLARGDLKVAIVGADLFGMSKSEIDPIEARLREKGISHLLVCMSHNHAAPDTIGIYGYYPREHVEHIQERIYQGVLEALGALQPAARLVAGSEELPLDGARVQGLFRNARNPGLVDPQMAVIQAQAADGKPLATFVHFACHVEGLGTGVLEPSADFPGYLCDELDRDLGGRTIFLNGAVGGMVSGDSRARTHEEAKVTGLRLAREAKRILSTAVSPRAAGFGIERHRLEIPLTNQKLILFQKMAEAAGRKRPLARGRIVTEMFHLRLGDAEMISIPGELLPELSFEVLERMSGYPRMILGLVNDELGYLLPGYDWNEGQYEESMSVGPAGGPLVRDLAIRMAEAARDPGRFGKQ